MNDVTQSLYAIPGKWLHELLALCGPEDHELRERIRAALAAVPQAPAAPVAVAVTDAQEAFELAYATEWHKSRHGDETVEQLAAEVKSWREGATYGDDLPRLKYGWEGYQWALAATPAAAEPVVPDGWVPCVVTYEGQHPEEVAYGPQIMMDRLKKWLERYFELKAETRSVVLPEPVTWLIERSAFSVSPHGQDAESNEWLEEAHEPGEKGSFPVYTEQQVRALLAQAAAPAAPAVDAETIHLQHLKNALADCKELREQVRLLDEQQAGSVWRWQADGQDQLETMGNNMGVLIRACDLRVLLAGCRLCMTVLAQGPTDLTREI